MIRILDHPNGPRLEVLGYRIHHFHAAFACFAAGVYLLLRDWQDFREFVGG